MKHANEDRCVRGKSELSLYELTVDNRETAKQSIIVESKKNKKEEKKKTTEKRGNATLFLHDCTSDRFSRDRNKSKPREKKVPSKYCTKKKKKKVSCKNP